MLVLHVLMHLQHTRVVLTLSEDGKPALMDSGHKLL